MGLNAAELDEVATELAAALPGAAVQKVHATPTTHTFLTLRRPQQTVVLCLCAVPQEARASILDERPTGRAEPGQASGFQQVLRRELTGARVTGCRTAGLELFLDLERTGKARTLVLSLGRAVALLDPRGTVLAAASAAQGVVLKPGSAFVPSTAVPGAAVSRLRGDGPLARARAAEALFTTLQAEATVSAARREVSQALKRLERTAAKVEADLARTAQAPRHRALGELLVRHAGEARRGARALELETYDAEGNLTRQTVALDPTRTPKEQAEWHFHQYRRLTRGAELARARLASLQQERAGLEARLDAGEALEARAPREKPKGPSQASPFREYRAADGTRIWVGKGAAKNDALTFQHAAPHHLWLHARGVPGAHVVLALDKNRPASDEALLDAATLAAHHSDAKGAPRVEVSATLVRYVRKAKGAPGAVTFTQEKTIALRLEPERLTRLVKTERTNPV